MKIANPVVVKKARIEVIPLIDIMFFLLAAFVLVSLTMVRQLTVEVNLPQAIAAASRNMESEMIAIALDESGFIWYGDEQVSLADLRQRVREEVAQNSQVPIQISGDRNVSYGAMADLLQQVRSCGAQKVAFALEM